MLDVAGPARAHRQGARHRPARRHRHPAADPRRRTRTRRSRTLDLRGLDPAAAEALCDRIAADRRPSTAVRARALEMVAAAKRRLAGAGLDAEQRRLLDLVADGVVQRYS